MRFHPQEVFIDFQNYDEAHDIFYYYTDGQTFGSSACSEHVPEVWGKVELLG